MSWADSSSDEEGPAVGGAKGWGAPASKASAAPAGRGPPPQAFPELGAEPKDVGRKTGGGDGPRGANPFAGDDFGPLSLGGGPEPGPAGGSGGAGGAEPWRPTGAGARGRGGGGDGLEGYGNHREGGGRGGGDGGGGGGNGLEGYGNHREGGGRGGGGGGGRGRGDEDDGLAGYGRGRGGGGGGGRPEREPTPLPDSAPFTAYVGNLPFDITEDDVGGYFEYALEQHFQPETPEDEEPQVEDVRLVRDPEGKAKGFGYVEFHTRNGLKCIIDAGRAGNLPDFDGRSLRVDVSSSRNPRSGGGGRGGFDDPPSRADQSTSWRKDKQAGGGLPPPRSGFSGGGRGGGAPRERPKLNLKPVDPELIARKRAEQEAAAAASAGSSSIFGGAKPIDNDAAQARILEARRAREQAERKQREAAREGGEGQAQRGSGSPARGGRGGGRGAPRRFDNHWGPRDGAEGAEPRRGGGRDSGPRRGGGSGGGGPRRGQQQQQQAVVDPASTTNAFAALGDADE